MGADLLLTALVHDKDKKLNWTEGRKFARSLPLQQVLIGLESAFGEDDRTAKEARAQLNDLLGDLKRELNDGTARDAHVWEIGDKVLHIRGGTSWGEDPSDGWTVFTNAYYFPEVLKVIGFDITDPPKPKDPIEQFVEEHGPEVQVAFTVPVEVVVDLANGTVTQVVTIDEAIQLDPKEGVRVRTTLAGVPDEVRQRAIEIADAPDIEWPSWQAGW